MATQSRSRGITGRTTMAIRSGRFKGDASGTGIPIIAAKAKEDAAYRIFNSGDYDPTSNPVVEVHAGYSPAPKLQPGCSLDVLIGKATTVTIKSTVEVVGSYDYLDRPDSFRSGRFNGDASGDGIPIIFGKTKDLYRVFNSGSAPFDIYMGTSKVATLGPTFSLDLFVSNNVVIKASGDVEGIYEYLNTELPVRSGRFKIKAAPTPDHKIIDLSSSTPDAYYRVFNSGDYGFKLQAGGSDVTGTVGPEQSFDFTIENNKDVTVVATGAYPIEGIYDLLSVEK